MITLTQIENKVNNKSIIIAANLCLMFEGVERKGKDGLIYPYYCPAGYPTQGIGRVVKNINNPPITEEIALEWLIQDLLEAQHALYRLSPLMALQSESRQGALLDFIFNLGAGRYQGSTLRRRVNQGDFVSAGEQIIKWVFAVNPKTGKAEKLKGLVLRREAEAKLLKE